MLIFKGDKLFAELVEKEEQGALPPGVNSKVVRRSLDLPDVWRGLPEWFEVEEDGLNPDSPEWIDLRAVWQRWGDEAFIRAGTAYQYMNWLRNALFCSRCGKPLSPKTSEKAMECQACGRVIYAPLHPAVIVAIERDGKLLLAHNARMPGKRYSVLAGFVEPGESLEQAVEREVMEEVGIEVEDIRYFGSQPWPFPCSLMLGFTARWKSGELHPDGVELNDAGWFAPGEFPEIPPGLSISRKLIDDFAAKKGR